MSLKQFREISFDLPFFVVYHKIFAKIYQSQQFFFVQKKLRCEKWCLWANNCGNDILPINHFRSFVPFHFWTSVHNWIVSSHKSIGNILTMFNHSCSSTFFCHLLFTHWMNFNISQSIWKICKQKKLYVWLIFLSNFKSSSLLKVKVRDFETDVLFLGNFCEKKVILWFFSEFHINSILSIGWHSMYDFYVGFGRLFLWSHFSPSKCKLLKIGLTIEQSSSFR